MPNKTVSLRELSKRDYLINETPHGPDMEHVKLGALQRIADSLTTLTTEYAKAITEREQLRSIVKTLRAENEELAKRNKGLRKRVINLKEIQKMQ